MLRELCDKSLHVNVNLGSSNKFDKKNPFKIEEREAMINLALCDYDNYELRRLPDFDSDDPWVEHLFKINRPFSEIISNNQYDLNIYRRFQFKDGIKSKDTIEYEIISPTDIVPQDKMLYTEKVKIGGTYVKTRKPMYVSGTFVRSAMVNDWNWEDFVDKKIAKYINENDLVSRIKEYCENLKGITLEKLEEDR
jgi:nicotinamide mononucleotide adenylyltransferase